MKSRAICLMGATATGKTDLALKLADAFSMEIVNVDSALVYSHMNIGTSKPEAHILSKYPHHLVNIISPIDTYNVATFVKDALQAMNDINSRGKTPLLVGGSMMYFKALQFGLNNIPKISDSIRAKLRFELETSNINNMYEKLQKLDSKAALKLHSNDTQRIMRALEVNLETNKSILDFYKPVSSPLRDWDVLSFALMPSDRALLHKNIEARFDKMLDAGLVDEVKWLCDNFNLNKSLASMRSVGYRQVYSYLNQEHSFDVMRDKAIAATRQLAKRQLTWLKNWSNLRMGDKNSIYTMILNNF